jgi:heme/copper-type cytochrome/quinol oxidase subunit 1
MTTIDTPAPATSAPTDVGSALSSVAGWITTADHKKIGRLFLGTSLVGAVAVAVAGLLVAVERIDADGSSLLGASGAQRLMVAFRVGLLFAVVLPALLGLAVAVVPLQLGARSLAFPRAALLGFYTWFAGVVLVVVSLAGDGGPTGADDDMVELFLLAIGLLAIAATIVAATLVVSVLTTRAPGMTIGRVPMLAWAALVGGVAIVVSMPVLLGDMIYLFIDHRNGKAAFGGTGGIVDWAGWALTQPATYVLVIIAVGAAVDIVLTATGARTALRGAVLTGIGLTSVAGLAAVTQIQHDLPWEGDGFFDGFGTKIADLIPYLFFNGLPVLGVLVVLGASAATLKIGRPRIGAAFVFAFTGLGMVLVGMLGHLVQLVGPAALVGTAFEEGELVYIGYGALLVALGGLVHWGPKLWGRRLPGAPMLGLAALGLIGTVLASLPLYVAGFADQPAGVVGDFSYGGPQELWNLLTAVGHGLVLVTVLLTVAIALRCFTKGEVAGDDPWDGATLEWATSSPPPTDNFSDVHAVSSSEPLFDLKRHATDGGAA